MKNRDLMNALSLAILVLAATGLVCAQEAPGDQRSQPARRPLQQEDTPRPTAPGAQWPGRMRLGDEIFVTDFGGRETGGRLLRLSPTEIVVLVGGDERIFAAPTVARVETRDSRWNGTLLGAVSLALLGTAGAGASCSPHCTGEVSIAAAVFGGIGAGVGALVDRRVRGYAAVFGPSLPPANAISQGGPVTSLGDLWTKVRAGDTVRVLALNGDEIKGRFAATSPTSIAILVAGQVVELPASDVRMVSRRGNHYRHGAFLGAGLMGLAAASWCETCTSGERLSAAAFVGLSGAVWGAGFGALIPRHVVVFDPRPAIGGLRVEPFIAPGRYGIALRRQF